MKKILVTGCNGQLGRAINKEYAKDNVEFINTDVQAGEGITALDITNIAQVMELARETRPAEPSVTNTSPSSSSTWTGPSPDSTYMALALLGPERQMRDIARAKRAGTAATAISRFQVQAAFLLVSNMILVPPLILKKEWRRRLGTRACCE